MVQADAEGQAAGAASLTRPGHPRILLVDDDPDTLESYAMLLQKSLGAMMVAAPSGDRALELLGGEAPDIIISDERMPGLSGIEFLSAARAKAPDAKLVMLTAFADPELEARARIEAGVARFLSKATSPEMIAQVLLELARSKAAGEALDA